MEGENLLTKGLNIAYITKIFQEVCEICHMDLVGGSQDAENGLIGSLKVC